MDSGFLNPPSLKGGDERLLRFNPFRIEFLLQAAVRTIYSPFK